MVELLVLNDNFQIIGIIDDFASLTWRRAYYKTGEYSLYLSGQYFHLINQGKYIYRKDAQETGIIENIEYGNQDEFVPSLLVSGRFLDSILADRVLNSVQYLKGTHEYVMRSLVYTLAIAGNNNRKIPRLFLGKDNNLGSKIDQQATGDNLLEKLYEIGATGELGLRVRYDYLQEKMFFEVYKGLDRTEAQTVNSWATFSTDFENLSELSYIYNDMDYKNFAYVAGEGENTERIVVEVDCTNGEYRRELYVDARDLSTRTDDDSVMTTAEYRALLTQRGLEKLAEYRKIQQANSNIDPNGNLKYKIDYDLGDKCTVCDKYLGISLEQRITEIEEVHEGGMLKISPVFGDGYITINEKLKREVKR